MSEKHVSGIEAKPPEAPKMAQPKQLAITGISRLPNKETKKGNAIYSILMNDEEGRIHYALFLCPPSFCNATEKAFRRIKAAPIVKEGEKK